MFTLGHILLSVILNAIALIAVLLIKSAPPRAVLYVCLIGMLAIVIPWSYLGTEVGSYVPNNSVIEAAIPKVQSVYVPVALASATNYSSIITIWLALGLAWLSFTILRSVVTKLSWRSNALCGSVLLKYANPAFNKILHRVRVFRLSDTSRVFATGLWRAEIWIGDDIQSASQIEAALNHELAHISANDQLTLFLIVAFERLLWWNPLIWLLGRQARRQMEYACDSRCQSLLGEKKYRQSLAELILVQQPGNLGLELTLGNKSDTITRLEKIGMTYFIKPNHILTLMLAGSLTAIASASFAAQGSVKPPTLMECHKLLPEGVQYNFRINSEIDTRDGENGHLSVSLTDQLNPDSRDVPSGAGDFLQCVQKVVGVGDNKGWPAT